MLVEGPRDVVEGPQLANRFPPAAEPIKGETVQLANGCNLWREPREHAQFGERLSIPVTVISPSRDSKPSLQARRSIGADYLA